MFDPRSTGGAIDLFQTLAVVAPIGAVLFIAWRRTWWSVPVALTGYVVVMLIAVSAAQATTKVEGGPANVPNHQWCNWFRVREQRYGVLDAKLWELREKVTWCTNASRTKVNYITRSWGHWASGGTWKFVRATRSGGRAANRSWYTRRVSAVFDGWTPAGLFNEEDDPFVWVKVYARPRGHVSWNSGCGC